MGGRLRRQNVRGFLVALFQSRFATCPSGVVLRRVIRLVAMDGLTMPYTRRRVGVSFTTVLARVSMFIRARGKVRIRRKPKGFVYDELSRTVHVNHQVALLVGLELATDIRTTESIAYMRETEAI